MSGQDRQDHCRYVLLEHLREGVIVCAPDGHILELNEPACNFLGRARAELLGMPPDASTWALIQVDGHPLPAEDHPVARAMRELAPICDVPLGVAATAVRQATWGVMNACPELSPEGALERVVATIYQTGTLAGPKRGLFESDRALAAVFLGSPNGIVAARVSDHVIVDVNDAFLDMYGFTRDEVVGYTTDELDLWPIQAERSRMVRELSSHGRAPNLEVRFRTKSGAIGVSLTSVELIELAGELCTLVFSSDISEIKKFEEELLFRETLLEETGRMAKVGGWRVDAVTGEGFWTDECARMLDIDPGDPICVQRGIEYYTEESRPKIKAALADAIEKGVAYDLELEVISAKGVRKWVRTLGRPVMEGGRVVSLVGSLQDVSDRRQVEESLRESEVRSRAIADGAPDGIFMHSNLRLVYTNKAFVRMLGASSAAELEGNDVTSWLAPEFRDLVMARIGLTRATGGPLPPLAQEYVRKDGSRVPVEVTAVVLEGVTPETHLVFARDISDRTRAEDSLRESEARFRTLVDTAPDGIFVQSGGRLQFVNEAFARMMHAPSAEDLLGKDVLALVAPEYRDLVRERMEYTEQTEGPTVPVELAYLSFDGSRVPVEATAVATRGGLPNTHLVFVRDISRRKRMESERESLQSQLLQSQKMQSIGQLAGGIAHDFNNILMVQKGYCDLMKGGLRPGDPLAQDLAQIDACTQRATSLTRQLLAFSRKQTLQPRAVDLNMLVANLGDMLGRLIGEEIDMLTFAAPEPARVKADPGQIEQVLVNLAVNARDAMGSAGTLTIEVSHADLERAPGEDGDGFVPGRYVVLAMTDTGEGMNAETMSRAFEPFFTTKPEGKGTGLGLSMVHGIVHQSGGDISVTSTEGEGTTFKIFLPVCSEEPAAEAAVKTGVERGRGETILVVEDEAALRRLAVTMLEKLGYRAVSAENGGAALLMVEDQGLRPDLILSDVVMPGMAGGVLVERLRKTMPDVKVVYMSGYPDDAIAREYTARSGHFLPKPFSMGDLSETIRASMIGR